jgi:hypothetical protein
VRGHHPAVRILALAAMAAVLVAGYLAGHRSSTAAPVERTHTGPVTADVLLTYPAAWRRVASTPEIPGLSIVRAAALAPGDGTHAGLVVGYLTGGEGSPLPARFVSGLRERPIGEVVDLAETQAYRYPGLSVPGFAPTTTLYALPNHGGNATVLACYATAALSAYLRACEQIVATLTLAGQAPSYALVPDSGYARAVNAAIAGLEGQRVALRRVLGSGAPPGAARRLATRAAQGFAGAAAAVSGLEPPSAVGQAQLALLRSLGQAGDAYTAMAAAAGAGDLATYASARAKVYKAEAGVDRALVSYSLLGYKRS